MDEPSEARAVRLTGLMETRRKTFIMRSYFRLFAILITAAASFSVSQASEYREDVLGIAKSFGSDNPETQYEARRNLEILVSSASAP